MCGRECIRLCVFLAVVICFFTTLHCDAILSATNTIRFIIIMF